MTGRKPLNSLEIKATLAAFDGPFKLRDIALFTLLLKSGFRISEVLSLRIKDVFQFGKVIDIVSVQRRDMKKKLAGRSVPLHRDARTALGAYLFTIDTSDGEAFVFQSQRGGPLGRIGAWRRLKLAFKKAKVTGLTGCHSGRKTFAQVMHQRLGRDIVKTAKALGHRSINSTVSYLTFDDNEITKAILK